MEVVSVFDRHGCTSQEDLLALRAVFYWALVRGRSKRLACRSHMSGYEDHATYDKRRHGRDVAAPTLAIREGLGDLLEEPHCCEGSLCHYCNPCDDRCGDGFDGDVPRAPPLTLIEVFRAA